MDLRSRARGGAVVSAVRWTRTACDGASEILTLVRLDSETRLCGDLAIEICAGPEVGDDFVGLYSLDGDQLNLGNASWSAVEEARVSRRLVSRIARDWESGTSTVTRLDATNDGACEVAS